MSKALPEDHLRAPICPLVEGQPKQHTQLVRQATQHSIHTLPNNNMLCTYISYGYDLVQSLQYLRPYYTAHCRVCLQYSMCVATVYLYMVNLHGVAHKYSSVYHSRYCT